MFGLKNLSRLDKDTVQRVGDVLMVAGDFNDHAVVEWGMRAIADACAIGKLRSRDQETLERLERTYSSDYYRNGSGRNALDRIGLQAT